MLGRLPLYFVTGNVCLQLKISTVHSENRLPPTPASRLPSQERPVLLGLCKNTTWNTVKCQRRLFFSAEWAKMENLESVKHSDLESKVPRNLVCPLPVFSNLLSITLLSLRSLFWIQISATMYFSHFGFSVSILCRPTSFFSLAAQDLVGEPSHKLSNLSLPDGHRGSLQPCVASSRHGLARAPRARAWAFLGAPLLSSAMHVGKADGWGRPASQVPISVPLPTAVSTNTVCSVFFLANMIVEKKNWHLHFSS